MQTSEPTYLTLSQVAMRTGRHPELLRQWCAVGRIPCTRVGGSWVLREQDLALVDGIPRRGQASRAAHAVAGNPDRTRIIAAVFDDDASSTAVAEALVERLGIARDVLGMTSLGVSGLAPLQLSVVAGRFPEPDSVEARRILVGYGGRIVADIDDAGGPDGDVRLTSGGRRRVQPAGGRRRRSIAASTDGSRPVRRSVPRTATP